MKALLLIPLLAFQLQAQELVEQAVDTARSTIKAKLVGYFQANSNIVCRTPDHAKQLAIYAAAGRVGTAKCETIEVKDCHQYATVFWEAYQEAHPQPAVKELTKEEQDAMELKAVQAIEAKNALVKKLVDYFKANPEIVCVSRDHAKQIIISAVIGNGKLPALKDVSLNDLHALIDEPFNAYLESRPVIVEESKDE